MTQQASIGLSVVEDEQLPPFIPAEELRTWLYALGRRVRLLRLSQELTQEELAERAGMSRSFVSLIEHGSHGPNLVRLYGLARAFGLEPWELLLPESQRSRSKASMHPDVSEA